MAVDATATEETKVAKSPSLSYEGRALAKPKKVDVLPSPVRAGGGGGSAGAADILEAFKEIEPHRDQWFLVAEAVANPGRYYDGFRGQGCTVKVNRNGMTQAKDKGGAVVEVPAFDVYAMVPAGDIKPWKKPSAKAKAQEKLAARGAEERGERPAGTQPRK